MKIVEQKQNPLLKRQEVKILVESEKNPTYPEAKEVIANEFKGNKDNILIRKVKGKFGTNTFLVSAEIYETKEDKEKFAKAEESTEGKEKSEESAEQNEQKQKQQEQKEEKKEEEKAEEKQEEKKKDDGEKKGENK